MSIRLQFSNGGLSQWWTPHWATHVDAVLPDGGLLGARPVGGVEIRSPTYCNASPHTEIVTIPVSGVETDAFYSYLYDQVGKGYNFCGLFHNDRWSCAELIAYGLMYGAPIIPAVIEPAKLAPRDIYILSHTIRRQKK